jgi:hypothetical protein
MESRGRNRCTARPTKGAFTAPERSPWTSAPNRLGDLQSDIELGLFGGCSQVRSEHHVRQRAERVVSGERFLVKHVQRSSGEPFLLKPPEEGRLVEHSATRGIDDDGFGLH